jgi:hypothetical protein
LVFAYELVPQTYAVAACSPDRTLATTTGHRQQLL